MASTTSMYWRDVSVSVNGGTKKASSKTILHSSSGFVRPGEVMFIMGPSGSGKSTLLDTLASRSSNTSVTGTQFLNGSPKSTKKLREVAKYVQQTDDLTGVLTVRETLQFYADLYMNASAKERATRVESVMKSLGLTNHAETKIGNAFFRGLSGGQKRRVSIGCELVANPQILFLDEPSSGLDSATAIGVLSELQRIAKEQQIAMVITIHQPSERLFELADTFMLISGGETCYFGDATKAKAYFEKLGYVKPTSQSNVEWMLDLVNKDFGDNHHQVDEIIKSWPLSNERTHLHSSLDSWGVSPKEKDTSTKEHTWIESYPVSSVQQVKVLAKRGILNAIRNPAVLWLRFVMYMILAVSMGLIWLRLGTKASQISSTTGSFYIVDYMVFMSVSVLPAYLEERSILIRERLNGAYSISSYILAHTIYETPYVFFLSLSVSIVVYFLVGFTPDFYRFIIYFLNLFASLFVAESIMVLISAIIPFMVIGIMAGAMIFGLFMCVQGFFISVDRIGWWLRWVKFVALHFYAYSTFMVNQYKGVTYQAEPPSFPEDIDGEDVYRFFGVEERIWVNFVALIVMIFVYRGAAVVWLQRFLKVSK